MNRIVLYLALFALLVSVVCTAPAKKSEETEQTEETKQIPQQTKQDISTNTAKETSKSEDKATNKEVTRYQDIQVDNDSKVTSENEPEKRAPVQKVAEHILTQNEAITLVTELTDQDYIEQYLYNEGAQGLFDALELLRDQGWITDIEYTIISDSIYQQMMDGLPYEVPYASTSFTESEQVAQPVYQTAYSSEAGSEQQVALRLASIVGSLLERVSDKDMTAEEGAQVIAPIIELLYGMGETDPESAYSQWSEPEQLFDLPNGQGYKQDFDLVNSEGQPIGKAEEIVETYKTDDGKLGQELAALEKIEGKIGDNGVFQGQQQTIEKAALIPLSQGIEEEPFAEELGSGFEGADTNFLDMMQYYMNGGKNDKYDEMLGKIGNRK